MPDSITTPKFLDLEQNYIIHKGIQYEVCFKSSNGQEAKVIDPKTLRNILKILEASIDESQDVDLSKTVLTKDGLTSNSTSVKFPNANASVNKRVDALFKSIHNVVKFDKITFNPRTEFPALKNIGNSCYMDASLEFLISVKDFVHRRLKEAEDLNSQQQDRFNDRQKKLLVALKKFFDALETRNFDQIQQAQKEVYKNTGFKKGEQQDPQELLVPILDLLQVNITTKVTTKGKIHGSDDAKIKEKTEPNTMLLLGTSLGNNLLDILKTQYSTHGLDDPNPELRPPEDMNFDDTHKFIGQRTQESKLVVANGKEPPEVIFVQFKRTKRGELKPITVTEKDGTVRHTQIADISKNSDPIDFAKNGQRLNLSEIFDADSQAKHNGSFEYEITGIINHSGKNYQSGHYTAKVKHEDTGEWFDCNDSAFLNRAAKINPGKEFDKQDQEQVYMIALKRVKPAPQKQP